MSFCRTMAGRGFNEETDGAYSNALDFLGIDEPADRGFSYVDGVGGSLYQEVEEAMSNPNSPNYEKYIKIRKLNLHKMEPIPVCKIPN